MNNFINKETPTQVLSCNFCKGFENTNLIEHLLVAASGIEQQILLG